MTVQQAIDLIGAAALPARQPQYWADLGCGAGLFTTALAQLLPTGSTVYGVDTHPGIRQQDIPSSGRQQDRPTSIIPITADFVKDPLDLPVLDGILMANSLHYVKDKPSLIQKLRSHLHPDSPLLIVEYDTDRPVPVWVPYPISYDALARLFKDHNIQKLGERPSAYGRANMYAALVRPR
jgi:trans-aconitate methyltransferase